MVTIEEHGEHTLFKGIDEGPWNVVCYVAGIIMGILRRHRGNVILVYEMNDEASLCADEYPVREVLSVVVG